MSRNTPNPVALTSAMLVARAHKHNEGALCELFARLEKTEDAGPAQFAEVVCQTERVRPITVANLASAIHRIAPACKRLAEAECNGEWHDGQRAACYSLRDGYESRAAALNKSITDYATRLDRRIVKLNAELAPFSYQLIRSGDPRGATLCMAETPVNASTTHYTIG